MMPMTGWRRCLVALGLAVSGIAAAGRDLRLVDAVKNADRSAVRALLQQGADVNAPQGDGGTALHWAAYRDDGESADLLIRAGARVNAANDLGVTPLWLACESGSANMARRLLQAGANPSAALLSGETLLMTAARTGNADIVEQLLARGAHVNVTERGRGHTALMWAVAQQHADVVEVLLAHGADVRARSNVWTEVVKTTAATANAGRKCQPSEECYITDIQQGGYTPLLFAARVGDLASAKLLVAAGADVNDTAPYGTSATVVAAHSGHGALAAFLLEHGADPNAAGAGYTALHAAILRRDEPLVKTLLAHGANPNAPVLRSTPYRRDSVDFYVQPGYVGATPFWLAARHSAPALMRLLADHGADPRFVHRPAYWVDAGTRPVGAEKTTSWVMEGDTTALMAAAGVGGQRSPLVAVDRLGRLAERDPLRGRREGSIIEREAETVTLETVKVAAELGVDVNVANADGNTALHLVAARGYDTVVKFLVEQGARLDVTNKKGQTPLASALAGASRVRADVPGPSRGDESTRSSTVELLRKLGARQ